MTRQHATTIHRARLARSTTFGGVALSLALCLASGCNDGGGDANDDAADGDADSSVISHPDGEVDSDAVSDTVTDAETGGETDEDATDAAADGETDETDEVVCPVPQLAPRFVGALDDSLASDIVSARWLPDDGGRFFLVQRDGRVIMLEGDGLEEDADAEVLLDLRDTVESSFSETGMLDMEFEDGTEYVWLSYTTYATGRTLRSRVSRFTYDADTWVIDADSEVVAVDTIQPTWNHNGGQVRFGPDGFLYASFGDGGGANDTYDNGQNTESLLGTILRIDVSELNPKVMPPYAIPEDNPFAGHEVNAEEIYLWGLRNTWRFSFDDDGSLWAADVGQNRIEEVNRVTGPGNMGWPIREGSECFNSAPPCGDESLIDPVYEYGHSLGESITGGFVYRGSAIPELVGDYIAGDFVSGSLFLVQPTEGGGYEGAKWSDTRIAPSAFVEGPDRELYVLNYRGSAGTVLFQIQAVDDPACNP